MRCTERTNERPTKRKELKQMPADTVPYQPEIESNSREAEICGRVIVQRESLAWNLVNG